MDEREENIFDYELNELERTALNLRYTEKDLYLMLTPYLKRLVDLHLLFLLRRDKGNRMRIMNILMRFEDKALEYF